MSSTLLLSFPCHLLSLPLTRLSFSQAMTMVETLLQLNVNFSIEKQFEFSVS